MKTITITYEVGEKVWFVYSITQALSEVCPTCGIKSCKPKKTWHADECVIDVVTYIEDDKNVSIDYTVNARTAQVLDPVAERLGHLFYSTPANDIFRTEAEANAERDRRNQEGPCESH